MFDWLGVQARVAVANATWVRMTASTTAKKQGTRLHSYISDQGFPLYPTTHFYVSPMAASNTSLLFVTAGSPVTAQVTVENTVSTAGYSSAVGLTTVHSFDTDGAFVAPPTPLQGPEFVGDSITAATNMVRHAGAPGCV